MKNKNRVIQVFFTVVITAMLFLKNTALVVAAPDFSSLASTSLCATECEKQNTSFVFDTAITPITPSQKESVESSPVVVMQIPQEEIATTAIQQNVVSNPALFSGYASEVKAPMSLQVQEPTIELKSNEKEELLGLDPTKLFEMINAYRVKRKLPALIADQKVCSVTKQRAPELYGEIFITRNMHAGFYRRSLPYKAVENIIHYSTEEGAVGWWLRSPIHHAAIVSKDYTHTCIACKGNSCAQIFAKLEE